jgi:SlyX protein
MPDATHSTSDAIPPAIEARLTALEIKASFADDLLDELNQLVIRQQAQIELLLREVRALREQMPEGGSAPPYSLREQMPPHY